MIDYDPEIQAEYDNWFDEMCEVHGKDWHRSSLSRFSSLPSSVPEEKGKDNDIPGLKVCTPEDGEMTYKEFYDKYIREPLNKDKVVSQ